MIETRNLGVNLGRRTVLDNIDFIAKPGEVTVILGQNGSGKTTLMRALSGEIAYLGSAHINGSEVRKLRPQNLARIRAVLPQHTSLPFPFTVREVVQLGADASGMAGSRDTVIELCLKRTGMTAFAGRLIHEMSGGEQQRAHMARVLAQVPHPANANDPSWLFLDEPVSSLDLKHQVSIMQTARDFALAGGGVIAVLHDINLALQYADHVHLLKSGRTFASGSKNILTSIETLSACFGTGFDTGMIAGRHVILPAASAVV